MRLDPDNRPVGSSLVGKHADYLVRSLREIKRTPPELTFAQKISQAFNDVASPTDLGFHIGHCPVQQLEVGRFRHQEAPASMGIRSHRGERLTDLMHDGCAQRARGGEPCHPGKLRLLLTKGALGSLALRDGGAQDQARSCHYEGKNLKRQKVRRRIVKVGDNKYARALSVSANGSVVVGYSLVSGGQRAFRWTAGTGMVDLGALPLPGLSNVQATDVSADGSVIIGWCQTNSGDRAFRWTQATGMVDLGPAPGATDSRTYGVSADGSVAVGDAIVSFSNYRATRWASLGHPRDLQNDLVSLYGLGTQLAGWNLTTAVSCSANGRIIAGYGTDPAGHAEAWIAQVDPLPPQVTATQVNGGAVQRSRVTDLAVTFDGQVNFASSANAAFTLTRVSDGAPIGFTATAIVVDGMSVVVLDNFTGSATQLGSLADGRYALTAIALQISAGGATMTSDYHFGDAQGLYRMFGDVNGDQTVNGFDLGFFRNAFGTQAGDPNYLSYLDYNGDGVINGFDLGQFRTRFGTMLP